MVAPLSARCGLSTDPGHIPERNSTGESGAVMGNAPEPSVQTAQVGGGQLAEAQVHQLQLCVLLGPPVAAAIPPARRYCARQRKPELTKRGLGQRNQASKALVKPGRRPRIRRPSVPRSPRSTRSPPCHRSCHAAPTDHQRRHERPRCGACRGRPARTPSS